MPLSAEELARLSTHQDVLAIRCRKENVASVKKSLKCYILRGRRVRNVVEDATDPEMRLVLLRRDITRENLPSEIADAVQEDSTMVEHKATFGFEQMTVAEALACLLKDEGLAAAPTAFETVGRIAHLNLKPEHLPFKNTIGEVILAKNGHLRTVVNKIHNLEDEFRALPLELLAGENNFEAEVRENGLTLRFPYDKVFWNSRLSHEREVLCEKLPPGCVLVDVMAGAGALCCQAASRKRSLVWANDLNPDAFRALQTNFRLNKVTDRCVAYNLDGGDFIRRFFEENHLWLDNKLVEVREAHFVLNLPQIAIDFLPRFEGVLADVPDAHDWRFVIHCYCFAPEVGFVEDITARVREKLPHADIRDAVVRPVRNVAPRKSMFCWEWQLDLATALASSKRAKSG